MEQPYWKQKKILLVDDEKALLDMVRDFLQEDGYTQIKTAGTAAEAVAAAKDWNPDFAVLDVMLPDGDGFSLLERLRTFTAIPVLFLTARGEDEDKIKGLGRGPTTIWRNRFYPGNCCCGWESSCGGITGKMIPLVQLAVSQIDFSRAEVIKHGEHLPLTAKEYAILQALSRNVGRIVTIDQLCEAAWGENPFGYENSLMAHIRRIREKIEENPSRPVSLITVKGLGYKLVSEG